MAVTGTTKVYKNEDANNPEYATIEEVKQAFFGRGVFIKEKNGIYSQVIGFNPSSGRLYNKVDNYELAKRTEQ